jgi:toxin HigB-1
MRMIKSIRGTATRQFVESGKSKFSGLDTELADQRLAELDTADALSDFGALKSVGLHKLTGDRRGFWSIKINGPWRIVFRFKDGDAYDVEILDYHK